MYCVAMQSKEQGWCDLHFKWARYRQKYMKEFFKDERHFLHKMKNRQTVIESLIPASLLEKNHQEVMRSQDLALCRVNLDSTSCVFQIGSDISDNVKWHVVVCGKKDNKCVTVVLTVDNTGVIKS
jgi:hypothetical protein